MQLPFVQKLASCWNFLVKLKFHILHIKNSEEYKGLLISPYPDQEGNRLQRPNSGFIQHTPHEAQYTLGRPGRGASHVEKSTRLNWATPFLTVACDGACSPNVSIRTA